MMNWNTDTGPLLCMHGPVLCRVRGERTPMMLMMDGLREHPTMMLGPETYHGACVEHRRIEAWMDVWHVPLPDEKPLD